MPLDQDGTRTNWAPDPTPPGDGCHGCSACAGTPEAVGALPVDAPLSGTALVGAAAFFFLLPLAIAMTSAALAGPGTEPRSLAAGTGLLLGMVLTVFGARRWSRRLGHSALEGEVALHEPRRETTDA